MRRCALVLLYTALMVIASFWTACGGDGGGGVNKAAKVVITPTTVSLNKGDVTSISAAAQDSNGVIVAADLNYTSSDPALFTVTPAGVLCGGTWSSDFVSCTPGAKSGSATLTVTTKVTGVSSTATIFVHDQVGFISITGGSSCTSSADTQQLSADAFSNDPAVCAGLSLSAPCKLPASQVGPINFGTVDSDVVSIDNTTDRGKATAGIPGRTFVFATVSAVVSPAIIFETCPVKSVTLAIKDSAATNVTIEKAGTASLVAVAKDTNDKELTSPPLSWVSAEPFVLTGAAGSPATTGTVTGANPGFSFVQASCIPPSCNRCTANACTSDTVPVYSNQITTKVNGTSNGTVYAASQDSTQLVPIDVTANTVGTAITLPNKPNSMVVNGGGTRIVLGASGNPSMSFDPNTSAVTAMSINATALGFTRDGNTAVMVDDSTKKVYEFGIAAGTINGGYVIDPILNHIDSSLGGLNLLATNGSSNFYSLFPTSFTVGALSSPANDVSMLLTGQAAYLAGGAAAGISVRAQCDGSLVDSKAATGPELAESMPNGDGSVFVDSTSLILLHNVNSGLNGAGHVCPPVLTETRDAVSLGLPAGFKANQLLVTPDSSKALVSTDKGLVIVNLSTLTATKVTLGGGAVQTFTGGTTPDSKWFYVGADDGTVHRIDLSNNTDVQQIAVALKKSDNTAALPQFVVVRNKS